MNPDPYNVAIGRAITTFREANALSPEELAERASLPLKEVEEAEAGTLEFTRWGDMRRISYALGVQLPQVIALGEKFAERGAR